MGGKIQIRAHFAHEYGKYSIMVSRRNMSGVLMVASNITLDREVKEYEPFGEPTMRLDQDEAQMLMNQLWATGLRPINGEGNPGHLGAVGDHLKDMRMLVNHYTKGGILK